MLTLIFLILMFVFFGNMLTVAIKLTWGFAKIFLGLIFLPIILIVIAFVGFVYLSVFFLVFGGIVMLIGKAIRS